MNNTAMLGKHVWDMIHRGDKIWVQMLRAKYYPHGGFLFCETKSGSFLWNSLCKALNVLQEGYVFKVRNGASSIWYDPWLFIGPLWKLVPFVQIHDTHLRVCDILAEQQWHLDDIRTTALPQQARNAILSCKIPRSNPTIPDVWIWNNSPTGVYSVRSDYVWLQEQTLMPSLNLPHVSWSWLWKLKIPENIKFLVWLIGHGLF
ncbi:hypothetical protein RIF29_23027 [Crotalaria pallida]|uniref:Reverse transcriptase zinc-binding domain-containing protein n=1 Tax=Crotalaria pallida TaxID=3830 RepID=A0AAN9IAQ9_CROPI